jgi:hypothetical protein
LSLNTPAGAYVTKLPKAEHDAPEGRDGSANSSCGARRPPTRLARIGIMGGLNRKVERVLDPTRKETHWGKRKLKRDG